MLRRLLGDSAGQFWWPVEFENVGNPDFRNLQHLQKPGHLPLTADSKCNITIGDICGTEHILCEFI